MFAYPISGPADYQVHTVNEVDRYVDAACWWYKKRGLEAADPSLEKAPVVALLTPSCLDAIISFFALNRLGWAVLFLSTRLTAPAYTSLMELADCKTIVAPPMYDGVIEEMRRSEKMMHLTHLPRITDAKDDYRSAATDSSMPRFFRECDLEKESKKVAWIIHSSGSTGFPKPIFVTNFGCLANFQKGLGFRSFTVSPLFHSHALMEFGRAIYAKRPIYFGNHQLPVTRQNLLASLKVAKPEIICAVPYVLKLLAEKEEGIVELAKAKVVMYGGSACPDPLGDELVSKGVNLAGNYGATETGFIMNSFRPEGDNEWNYLRLHRPVADHVLMDEISPGIFECVALDGLPSKVTTNTTDPPGAFRTKDLFVRHPDPEKSNYWKYVSRLDDRLTLVNGEKVLPLPIEGHIRKSELINEVAVFGFQRTVPGVIVFRSEHAAMLSDEEFVDKIWPRIEDANNNAETFSRIPRDLVIPRPSDEAYPRTDKGTIIRAQMYEQYRDVIDEAYRQFEGGPSSNDTLLALDMPALEGFLLTKFRTDLAVDLESADTDIFSAGVDSLQTTRIWNIIKKELDLGEEGNGDGLSQNVVFECGNVRSLAQHLYNLRLGIEEPDSDCNSDHDRAEIQNMQDLIDKYSTFTPHDAAGKPEVKNKTVLLTGVTGGLGSILLANLLRRDDVVKVYCLVRASDAASARSRVMKALRDRDLTRDLPGVFEDKIHAYPSDLSLPSLGLDGLVLDELLSRLTHIIHSAWAVNFNLPLLSFEPQHIRGVYNLIQHVALRTTHSKPAEFWFCSSVSAASGTPKPSIIPEKQITNLSHAQRMGYGRSKLVAERITNAAATGKANCVARVLRIGQLAGDTKRAVWNDTEAIALMIRSALPSSAGCLPRLSERPSWLPVDKAAEVIEELVLSSSDVTASDGDVVDSELQDTDLVYHIVNPNTFSFQGDLLPMLQTTETIPKFEIVDPQTWLDTLKKSDGDVERNPSRKLIGYWEGKYGDGGNSSTSKVKSTTVTDMDDPIPKTETSITGKDENSGLTFDTTRTTQQSSVLQDVKDPVSDGLMKRIVEVWMKKWNEELRE
ncbi:putative NRPS-like protein biosynthetic cluster [Exophiala oligosperma]